MTKKHVSLAKSNFDTAVNVWGSTQSYHTLMILVYDTQSKPATEDVQAAKKGKGRAKKAREGRALCDWGVIRPSHDPPDTNALCNVQLLMHWVKFCPAPKSTQKDQTDPDTTDNYRKGQKGPNITKKYLRKK